MASTVPFQYLMHLLTVPVWAGETETRFIVDTGIGVNLISDSLAARSAPRRPGRSSPAAGCPARR